MKSSMLISFPTTIFKRIHRLSTIRMSLDVSMESKSSSQEKRKLDEQISSDSRFYDWSVVLALIAAKIVYHEQLTAEAVEQHLQKKQISTGKTPSSRSGRWWSFYSKKVSENEEWTLRATALLFQSDAINVCPTSTTTEALAWALKSEDVPSISKGRDLLRKNS